MRLRYCPCGLPLTRRGFLGLVHEDGSRQCGSLILPAKAA